MGSANQKSKAFLCLLQPAFFAPPLPPAYSSVLTHPFLPPLGSLVESPYRLIPLDPTRHSVTACAAPFVQFHSRGFKIQSLEEDARAP